MGVPLAKASAYVSANVLATCSPKLHSEVKLACENVVNATADTRVNVGVKAFSDNYLSVGNDSKIENSNVLTGSALGIIGMVLLAIILTGHYLTFVVSTMSLLAAIALAVKYTLHVQAEGEDALVPRKASAQGGGEQVLMLATDHTVTQKFMSGILRVENPKRYADDASCVGITQFMTSVVKFQLEYDKMTYFLDGTNADIKIQPSGGDPVPEALQNLTVRQLGERLYTKMKAEGRDFCGNYQLVQRALTNGLAALENKIEVRLCGRNQIPLDEDVVKRCLALDDLLKATKHMNADRAALVKEAELFLHNVYRGKALETSVQALLDEVLKIQRELEVAKSEIPSLQTKVAKYRGEKERLAEKKKNINMAKQGQSGCLQYYEKQLLETQQKLESARQDEKRYTFWMFGRLTSVWENDVKLAKEKVKTYETQKDKLETLVADLKCGRTETAKLLSADSENIAGDAEVNETNLNAAEKALEKAIGNAKDLEKNLKATEEAVQKKVAEDGKESVKHLLAARLALTNFSQSATADTAMVDHIQTSWQRDAEDVALLMEEIKDAPRLKDQWKALQKVKTVLKKQRVPLLGMISNTRAKFTLVPGPGMYNQNFLLEDTFGRSVSDLVASGEKRIANGQNREATEVN